MKILSKSIKGFVFILKKLMITIFISAFFAPVNHAQGLNDRIRLNQIGFYPESPKIAVITDNIEGDFLITSASSGEVVYKSKLSSPLKSAFSPQETRVADFSEVKIPGTYKLTIPGHGDSFNFKISPGVFCDLTKGLIKGFYYQRMSATLLPEYAGQWSHAAGHPDTGVIIHPAAASNGRPEGTLISCPRGWYDAGDYNKYIVNSGITMGTLLSLYEDYPDYFDTLITNIPESRDNVPDLLNEIVWNLRWMLTMQDPYDGGVYNKVTTANFAGMVMPSAATEPRYIVPKGTAATLDFAAVMAQSGRIFYKFKKEYPGLADSCLKSAIRAWNWAVKNPDVAYNQNQMNKLYSPVINTGGYGDSDFSDEFIWAAAELYITTKENNFYNAVSMFPDTLMPLPSWGNVRLLGYYTLARFEMKLTDKAKKDFPIIRERMVKMANSLIEGISDRSYQTVMGKSARDFEWGSNSVAANQGIMLIQAYRLTGEKRYMNYALANLDYIMGRNATGYSYVTGFGYKTPMFPHHRPSEADGIADPIPGLIVGGPNPGKQDKCATYTSDIPDESYTDSVCSYASNEIAINWNAPAAYLAGALDALFSK
ncbi:MAG TPA: glycoside hydrolase family 9 protein [Bacteroidales bacterium]|nr:glycoside hydrolase family 9 protein [Bacteroidales bacterium]